MKKSIVLAAITLFGLNACTQKMDPKNVPAPVKAAMEKAFPGIAPKWEKEDATFEASFKKDGHEMSAVFDANGGLLETEAEIAVSELPAKVVTYVNEKYKGEKIKEASKITDQKGKTMYEAALKGKDIIFDADGNFIKEIKE